ncbi:MAG: restriction endonuclease subunit S [Clostridiales bacterium]|nr:restriction endonuclease subunit S [Clostridiales bacterium]
MKSNYKLGDIIDAIDNRNTDLSCSNLKGLSMIKEFRESTSNIVGTDLSKYKIVKHNQFAVDFMSAIRVHKMPIALNVSYGDILVSPAYMVFKVKDENIILSEYLMMWFSRPEFDRYADFRSDAAIRGGYGWNELCDTYISVPDINEQREIVKSYKIIANRILLKKKINDNLVALTDIIFSKVFLKNKVENSVVFTDIVQLMGGGTPKTDEERFWNGEILFFTPKDVSDSPFCITTEKHLSDNGLENCSSQLYPRYTTFVTCRGTVGNLSIAGVPMAMNQSCYALKGKNGYPPFFVYSFTRYVITTMKKKASGAVFSALVTRDFEIEKVFEPDIKNALEYQSCVTPLFDEILSNTKEMQILTELSHVLLARLIS